MSDIVWREPVAGFRFEPAQLIVERAYQQEKLRACKLDANIFADCTDPSFFIGLGIKAGIAAGISAEGNVNMLTTLIQHYPVKLDETLIVQGEIQAVTKVDRGLAIDTEVEFLRADGKVAISTHRRSLKPNPQGTGDKSTGKRGAGERPPPVIEDTASLQIRSSHQLDPQMVCAYSMEGNSIHYEMEPANRAGFRAPIIGGGMGVHFILSDLWPLGGPTRLEVYFRRPIFWDDSFQVGVTKTGDAAALVRDGKVLTEVRITRL